MENRDVIVNIKKDYFTSKCFGREIYISNIIVDERQFRDISEITRTTIKKLQNLKNSLYVTCKHNLSDIPVIHGLEGAGFKLMSVNVKFRIKPDAVPKKNAYDIDTEIMIEQYSDKHLNRFYSLIKNVPQFFDETQYYNSPYLDKKLCDSFYRMWILTDIKGRSDRNYLAIYENRIVGFILCIERDNESTIDLMWVDKNMRGRGIGKLMIHRLFNDVRNRVVRVTTQMTNSNAINFYIKTGFEIENIYAVYHKYGDIGHNTVHS
ncbi:dTDP-fucosamine acetyltransferase [subsurface metagenome]